MNVTFFASADEMRAWLATHGADTAELWVGIRRVRSGPVALTYGQALDEALCAGWIDGLRKTVDEVSYAIRFTPRRAGSTWSEVNLRRASRLGDAGRLLPAGLAALEAADPARTARSSHEARTRPLGPACERLLRANGDAWAFWQAQAPSYGRAASWYVMSAAREETRCRRIAVVIEDAAAGRRIAAVTLRPKGR